MHARPGSVYLAVIAVVSAVTTLTLVGVALRKEINERARTGTQAADVRRMAASGAELAVDRALTTPAKFVSLSKAGTSLYDPFSLGSGTLSVSVTDEDTDAAATSATERFRVVSDARSGEARSRLGMTIRYQEDDLTQLVESLGAVAYWPLDEKPGDNIVAERIAGRTGSYNNTGAVGKLTHAHGNLSPRNYWVDEYARVPHSSAYEIDTGTIAFWAKWDILPSVTDAAVVSKEGDSAGSDAHFAIYLDTSGRLTALLQEQSGDKDGGRIQATGVIKAGTWHHIAVSWGNYLCIWVDGKLATIDGSIQVALDSGEGVSANTRDWYFGVRNKTYLVIYKPAYFTYGSVARVALFDKNLSKTQIDALRAATSVKDKLEVEPGSYARVVD